MAKRPIVLTTVDELFKHMVITEDNIKFTIHTKNGDVCGFKTMMDFILLFEKEGWGDFFVEVFHKFDVKDTYYLNVREEF